MAPIEDQVSQSTLDLTAARGRVSFSPAKVNTLLLAGGRDTGMKATINKIISSDPGFSKVNRPYMSRGERISNGLRLTKRLFDLVDAHDWDYLEFLDALSAVDETLGLYLHEIAFLPVLNSQCNSAQAAIWIPQALNHSILGCYLQTELEHGSNVSGLQTTATYIHASREFILDSGKVGGTKWWIGGLGVMATHGVVQARLIIGGRDFGPHLFITQLRSLVDHSLMPGVSAGEIGPKVFGGFAATDNGWARFDRVQIPLDQMLAKFARIDDQGAYVKPAHDKLSYGGMVFIRAQMIGSMAWSLAKAATIATRYLHVRRQFTDPEVKVGQPSYGVERQVITYPSVDMRVIPQVAKCIAFMTAAKDMSNLYDEMSAQLADGDTTLLAETHAVSAGLKSYVSTQVVESIEVLRRAMGGHGFMNASGLGSIYASNLPAVTYEGDNFILNLQVVRAALKTFGIVVASGGKMTLSPSSAYFEALANPFTAMKTAPASWLDHELLLRIVSLRAALHVKRLALMIQGGKKSGDLSWECVAVSRAIVEAFLVRRVLVALGDGGLLNEGVGPEERQAMRDVIHFYILYTIEAALPDLLEFGIIAPSSIALSASSLSSSPAESLRAALNDLALIVLDSSVGLVDGFGFSDYDLDSALGNYNGRPYETLLKKAIDDDLLNTGGPAERKQMYDESIKPILERGKRLSKL